jgi:hypothetical protein
MKKGSPIPGQQQSKKLAMQFYAQISFNISIISSSDKPSFLAKKQIICLSVPFRSSRLLVWGTVMIKPLLSALTKLT